LEKIQTADRRTHYVEMDALRGLAVLIVVMNHIAGQWKYALNSTGGAPPRLPLTVPLLDVDALDLFFFGGLGLWSLAYSLGLFLFFLLAGYLLSWSEDERMRNGTYSVRSYALRRIFRILPAYYVAVVIDIAMLPRPNISVEDVLLNTSFLYVVLNPLSSNTLDGAFWSLTSEVICYLLLPFIIVMLPWLRRRVVVLFIVLGLLFVLSSSAREYIAYSGLSEEMLERGTINLLYLSQLPSHLFLFISGVLLRMMVERLGNNQAKLWWRPLVASVLLLASVSLYVSHPFFASPLVFGLADGEIVAVGFFASAVLGAPFLRRVLRWKPLAFIGVISYSLYLLHGVVLARVAMYILQPVRSVAASGGSSLTIWIVFSAYALGLLVASIIISYLSYRYIESPFLRRKPM
jgi:peptidoglycan/LPS O-acetylase OafA/YrhL